MGTKINRFNFLVILLIVFLFIFFSFFVHNVTLEKKSVLVVKVFDGDTVLLENGQKVRLIGIDCPEAYESDKLIRDAERTGQNSKIIIEMSKKATEFTKNLVEGKMVRLELDVEKKDKYDRLLAYIFLKAPNLRIAMDTDTAKFKNGMPYLFINAEIVANGFAQPMTIPPNVKYANLFQKLYEEAIKNKRGLWKN